MSYLRERAPARVIADAIAHTRNKVIGIDVLRPTLSLRALRRVQHWCTAREQRLVIDSDPRVVVSEQLIENALVLMCVADSTRVLDFGGFESTLPLTLAALGKQVTVLDQRPYPFEPPGLTTIAADVLSPLSGLAETFDLVYSISTIEHVGLGAYTSAVADDGDRVALQNLWQTVRSGGSLLFTVPAGRPVVRRGYRVYDGTALRRIMPAPGSIRYFLKEGRFGAWREVLEAEIASHEYERYTQQTPVEGVAFVRMCKA